MMLFRIRLTSTLFLIYSISYLASNVLLWWVIRELLNLYAIYILFYHSKETSPADVNTYIVIMYLSSIVLFTRSFLDNSIIFNLRLLAKLNLAPIHSPVVNMCSKISPNAILSFFILPKLPYLFICSESPSSLFIIPAIVLIYTSSQLAPSEILRLSLVVSSNALAFAFSIDMSLRICRFLRAVVWGYLVTILSSIKNVSIKDNYYNFGYLFNIMLPIPRSYSWVIKVIILQERSAILNFHVLWWLTIMMSLPFWYILCVTLINYNKYMSDSEVRSPNMLFPFFISCMLSFIFLV